MGCSPRLWNEQGKPSIKPGKAEVNVDKAQQIEEVFIIIKVSPTDNKIPYIVTDRHTYHNN